MEGLVEVKKLLFIIPIVLLFTVGCSEDTPVAEKEKDKEEIVDTVEKEIVVKEDALKEEAAVEKETTPKDESKENMQAKDNEPMDDISDAPTLYPNEKVGYIKEIVKAGAEHKLMVDFAEMIIDDSHAVGFYIENKKEEKETIMVGGDVQVFILNGTELKTSSIENLAGKTDTLFTFIHDDAGKLFMIEEKYLP